MNYAILTPSGELYQVLLNQPPFAEGQTHATLGVLPVDETVPAGYQQDFSAGPETARGWHIVAGVVEPIAILLPPPPPPPTRWRVSKDTLISRVVAAGHLAAVRNALTAQSPDDQFIWNQSAWFWSDNAQLRGLCAALSVDADALLAPDPFLTD